MARKKRRKKDDAAASPPARTINKLYGIVLFGCLIAAGVGAWFVYGTPATSRTAAPAVNLTNPTFAADIAPLVHTQCAGCHHDGGIAPFALLKFEDVSKRAAQIVKVTQSRYMPPWLPEPGFGEFHGERRLSDGQVAMLKVWAEQGALEGDRARTPAAPEFKGQWQLGTPDLVVELPRAYTLPAEGRDVYRNFAVPVKLAAEKYIKGIEFGAGNSRIHHAFVYVDETPESRRLDGKKDAQPGWEGMGTLPSSAHAPSAQFTSWQPGKMARMQEDMAWKLSPGTDLVLQLHMQPSGKPEQIRPSVAFYFTDKLGTKQAQILLMRSVELDIPAGEKAHTVRAQFTTPVDIDVLAVLPHVHYLGKELRAFATLPDGSRTWLLLIKNWDFNWQGDYAYKQPLYLPRGSRIDMEYVFDNSDENPRNPNHPPKRVHYGLQSSDEMAELWVQLLPHDPKDSMALDREIGRSAYADSLALYTVMLRNNPADALSHLKLGKLMLIAKRWTEAESHLRSAIAIDNENSDAHYHLGYYYEERERPAEALSEYRRAAQLDRTHFKALNAAGWLLYQSGNAVEGEKYIVEALRLSPDDALIKTNLSVVRKALGKEK